MIRRCAWRNTLSIAGAMSRSGVVKPGHLGVGRVGHEQVDALLAQPGEGAQVGEPAVERQLVHLEVAGVQEVPAGVRTKTASASGIEWLTATNSQSKTPSRSRWPSLTPSV